MGFDEEELKAFVEQEFDTAQQLGATYNEGPSVDNPSRWGVGTGAAGVEYEIAVDVRGKRVSVATTPAPEDLYNK